MTAIVTEVVNTELANPQIKPFFDGTLPAGSTNFTAPANKAKYDKLAGGLVAFFGNALGCTDPTFPKYMGADMRVSISVCDVDRLFVLFMKAVVSVSTNLC